MTALPTHRDAPRHPDLADGDDLGRAWVRIDQAAQILGVSQGALRNRCVREWHPARLAFRFKSDNKSAWYISRSVDPRLTAIQTRDDDGAPSAAAALQQIEAHKRDEALARAAAVVRFRRFKSDESKVMKRDLPAFLAQLADDLGLSPSRSQLYQWSAEAPGGDDLGAIAAALIDWRGRPKGKAVSDDAWSMFEGLYLSPNQWSIAKCWRTVKATAESRNWSWPSRRTVERLVEQRITPAAACLAREGRDAWSRRFKAPMQQDPDAFAAGQCWEGDHARLDFYSRVQRAGRWVHARLWLTAWIDRRSRRLMGWHIDEVANSDTIRLALLDALRDDSVSPPEMVWIDNGKDFASSAIGGMTKQQRRTVGSATRSDRDANQAGWHGVLGLLGIEPHFGLPYNHNAKARVERFFGTVHADHDREYASWCGSDPTQLDKQRKGELLADVMALPTMHQVRERFAAWAQFYNARAEHAIDDLCDPGTGELLSPGEFYQRFIPARRVLADRGALVLLQQRWSSPLKVSKHGISLRLGGRVVRYGDVAPELEPYKGADRRVLVSFNPADTSRISVFDASGRFICEAPENESYGGVNASPVSVEARKRAWQARREQKRLAQQRINAVELSMSDRELAAARQRDIEVEKTRARIAEQRGATDAEDAPSLRIVTTPLDGQHAEREQAQLRQAVGAEFDDSGDDPVDLSRLSLVGARDDDDDDIDLADFEADDDFDDDDDFEFGAPFDEPDIDELGEDEDDPLDVITELRV